MSDPRSNNMGYTNAPLVLDLCCGRGGWAEGFARSGYRVVGFDILDYSRDYPGEFVLSDIREVNWSEWANPAVVTASPPCNEFSALTQLARARWGGPPLDPAGKGLALVRECKRVIDSVRPRYWILENVRRAVPYISTVLGPPRFVHSAWAFWGEFPGFLRPKSNRLYKLPLYGTPRYYTGSDGRPRVDRRNRSEAHGSRGSSKRAMIPLDFSLPLAEACKGGIA